MSLESKIEALTLAVEALTAKLDTLASATPASAPAAKAEPVELPAAVEAPAAQQGPSVADLQDLAMSKVREDRTKKTAIKELVASYGGAKVISDIPAAQLADFALMLGAL